jgi:hypothetical protein
MGIAFSSVALACQMPQTRPLCKQAQTAIVTRIMPKH